MFLNILSSSQSHRTHLRSRRKRPRSKPPVTQPTPQPRIPTSRFIALAAIIWDSLLFKFLCMIFILVSGAMLLYYHAYLISLLILLLASLDAKLAPYMLQLWAWYFKDSPYGWDRWGGGATGAVGLIWGALKWAWFTLGGPEIHVDIGWKWVCGLVSVGLWCIGGLACVGMWWLVWWMTVSGG
ncbi:hypothetical protein P154DRAFT_226723 [Amniculicola lignicola CBS 123094]|uniref:Uncharacterized protein n=1 Tax=Amniculicola lignicola CBS 123094 TaxID=1392246 RepID=A0A6A5WH67_9PLEO|nr:hypothetical protein P154DRAFT_226723 [Amniculicola lignicola CBS 123094]